MEVVYVLRTLWQRKWWVLGAFVLAVVAAIYVRYDVAPGARFGVATQEVLLDAPSSALGDLHRSIDPLAARSGVFARVLTSGSVVHEIARDAHLPAADIVVLGPPLIVDGVPDQSSRQRSGESSPKDRYKISVLRGDDLPLLSVSTQAPTREGARRLLDATTRALVRLVGRVQEQSAVPESRRLTIRVLGNAQARQAINAPSRLLTLAAFLTVFGLGCIVILMGPALVAALRAGNPPERLDGDLFRPLAPAGMPGNGSGDLAAERGESIDAVLEKATLATDDSGRVVPLDPEHRLFGDSTQRVLRRRRDS
jgi:hypothetical protein